MISLRRMQDRDIDNITNPHEVKHWMDPKLIPYGWGMFGGLTIAGFTINIKISRSNDIVQYNIQ